MPTPLAIIGMSCRFPGGETLDEFWGLLRDGRSAFAPLPAERLNRELHFSPEKGAFARTYCEILGQVSQRPVDRSIIDIPDDLAARHDLTHLTMCEVAASACRDAGYDPLRLPTRKTGVYLGNSSVGDLEGDVTFATHADQLAHRLLRLPVVQSLTESDRQRVLREAAAAIRNATPAGRDSRVESFGAHAAAGLISGLFGLTGPALASDAACAASFTSLLLASQALQLGEIDMAIVGAGACRSWCELIFLSIVQAMSGNGSRPFDADADGLIAADGYGALVLKTLPRALADGDRIVGVVRGVGMSSDGKGKGFWAPRDEGQQECMRRAYAWGADPSRVQYLHAHATSTQLGDATEMTSLAAVFGGVLTSKIPITSVKANIGHTLETAGMAGMIATLLAMRHATIPPAANVQNLNPEIPWNDVPFFVPRAAMPWPEPDDGTPRRAGIDAFGIGGLNTHAVIDDRPEVAPRGFTPAPSVLTPQAMFAPEMPIAVIGLGCVLPGAHSVDAFRELMQSGRDPKTIVPASRWDPEAERFLSRSRIRENSDMARSTPNATEDRILTNSATTEIRILTNSATDDDRVLSGRGGFLAGYEFNWKNHRIPPFQVANANPLQFALLDAADQALVDSGYAKKEFDRARATTLVGSVFTNDFCADVHLGMRLPEIRHAIAGALADAGIPAEECAAACDEYQQLFLRDKPGMADDTGAYSSSTLASRIAKQLDLGGGAMTIDAGDASSLAALASAIDLLRGGQCDLVVCAGGQRNMDLVRYRQLERQGKLDESGSGAGIVPAEGAVAFLLKRLDDARRDGDNIRAILHSVSAAREGDAKADCRDSAFPSLALSESLEASLWHDEERRAARAAVPHSLVPQLGHLQGGSGLLGALRAILSLEAGTTLEMSSHTQPLFASTAEQTGLAGVETVMAADTLLPATRWRLLLEGMAVLPPRPESAASDRVVEGAEESSESRHGRIEQLVLDAAFEQTGIPRSLLRLTDDLSVDLRLSPGEQAELLTAIARRHDANGPAPNGRPPRTLLEIVERLERE